MQPMSLGFIMKTFLKPFCQNNLTQPDETKVMDGWIEPTTLRPGSGIILDKHL